MSESYKIKRGFTLFLVGLCFLSIVGVIWSYLSLAGGNPFGMVWLAASVSGLVLTGVFSVFDIMFSSLVDKVIANEERSKKNEKRSKDNRKTIKGE